MKGKLEKIIYDHKWVMNKKEKKTLPNHVKICGSSHNGNGLISLLIQKTKNSIPARLDLDARKIFKDQDRHWSHYYMMKEK